MIASDRKQVILVRKSKEMRQVVGTTCGFQFIINIDHKERGLRVWNIFTRLKIGMYFGL